MKIVLLPGLDGTGCLFAPLLESVKSYDNKTLVISLPQRGSQDYLTLADFVITKLPSEEFILIAESFSGPIASILAQKNITHLRGIVFVATFLSTPSPHLISLAKIFPVKLLNQLPGAGYFQRALFLGKKAKPELLNMFQLSLKKTPSSILKARMQTLQSLELKKHESQLPAIYLLPTSDKLVNSTKVHEFQECFKKLVIEKVDGPHFILQAEPEKSAIIILNFVRGLNNY